MSRLIKIIYECKECENRVTDLNTTDENLYVGEEFIDVDCNHCKRTTIFKIAEIHEVGV